MRNENAQKFSAGEKQKQSPRRPRRVQPPSPHAREPISSDKRRGNRYTLRSTCTRHFRCNQKWTVVRTQPSTPSHRLSRANSNTCMPTTHRHCTAPRCRGTERGTGGAIGQKQRRHTTHVRRSQQPAGHRNSAGGRRAHTRDRCHAVRVRWSGPLTWRGGQAHATCCRTTSTARRRAHAAQPAA